MTRARALVGLVVMLAGVLLFLWWSTVGRDVIKGMSYLAGAVLVAELIRPSPEAVARHLKGDKP